VLARAAALTNLLNVVSPIAVSVVSLKVPFGLYVIVAVTLIEEHRSRS
jgi:hypothetical protein